MKVLLTGATGYLGSRLARRLIGRGHEVIAVVRDPARLAPDLTAQPRATSTGRAVPDTADQSQPASTGRPAEDLTAQLRATSTGRAVPNIADQSQPAITGRPAEDIADPTSRTTASRLTLVVADLRAPLPPSALRGLQPDALVHCAAEIRYTEPREALLAANRDGTRHAVDAALALGVRQILVVSSIEAAGPRRWADVEIDDDAPPEPANDYGASKLAGEEEARRLAQEFAARLVILRPGNIYGDGEPGFLKLLLETIDAGRIDEIHREWPNVRFLPVHVEDVLDAIELGLTRGAGVFNITSGRYQTVGELCTDLAVAGASRGLAHLNVPPPLAPPPAGTIHYPYGSGRAARELGYQPSWSLARGVIDLLDASGRGQPRVEVAAADGWLRTLLLNTPSGPVALNRDMGGGMGFVHENDDRFPPLDLLWLAATLEHKGWPVEVADGAVLKPPAPDWVVHHVVTQGIHCVVAEVNLPTFEHDLAYLRQLKRYSSARVVAKTVLSGPEFHARLLREAGVDAVLTGECDLTIDQVLLGRDPRGTVRLCGDALVAVPEEKLEDLDRLPLPARHLLDQRAYRYTLLPANRFTTIQSSRGCPYSCGYYCPYPLTQGKTWRPRSAAHVMVELEACAAAGIRSVLFRDATFTLSRQRVVDLCRRLQDRNLPIAWWCETRINCLDAELLRLMAQAGCRGINLGFESGSDEVLGKGAKPGVDVKRIRAVLAAARDAGIHAHLLVAVGLPDETRATILATYDLIDELPAGSLGVTGITPFPGTGLWGDAERNGWILSTDWSRYGGNDTVMRTGNLAAADIRFAAHRLFERFRMTRNPERVPPATLAAHRERMLAWVREGTTE